LRTVLSTLFTNSAAANLADVEMNDVDTTRSATCVGTLAEDAPAVAEPVIEREEVVALLFNASDIVAALSRIERLLKEEDDGEEEAHGG
jgi:hypothetical protein